MSTKSLLFAIYSLHGIVNSQCKWTVNTPSGEETFDLTCARGREFTPTDYDGSHTYLFSLCNNGETCNGNPVMAKQTGTYDPDLCYNLGTWDESIAPVYEADNGGRWVFTYANGANDCGNPARTWAPTFQCDSAEWAVDQVNEIPNSCFYTVTIHTKYACTGNTQCSGGGGGGGGSESGALSGGWIFIIILFSAFFGYCLFGYLIMGLTVNKEGGLGDVSNNIPQKTMWLQCPKLVIAGCMVTKETIMGLIKKDGDSDALQPMVRE